MNVVRVLSEAGKESWDLLQARLIDAREGIGKNKRTWLYRHTPANFERQNEPIELKAWLKGLLDSCKL